MKKIFCCLFIFSFFIYHGFSQEFNLNAYGLYVFADRFDSSYDYDMFYKGRIEDGFQWGTGAEYLPIKNIGIELLYLRQDTNAPTRYQNYYDPFVKHTNFDLGINYIMLSGNLHYFMNPKTELTGGLMFGGVITSVKDSELHQDNTYSKFAWGLKIGSIYWINASLGILFQGQVLSPIQNVSGEFYIDDDGPAVEWSSNSTIYQFSLGGGLVFQFQL